MAQAYIGQIINAKSFDEIESYTNGFVIVQDGKITDVGADYQIWREKNSLKVNEVSLTEDQFLMSGFVDTHIHAPQVAQIGLGLDLELLDWLNKYTFPLEANYSDKEFAEKVYKAVVATTIKCGTTLASYFGTNHKDSTIILAKEAIQHGQRALIGKTCSDRFSPEFYIETTKESVAATLEFVQAIKNLKTELVKPTITPRFALSCTTELLTALGDIARENDLHIQSHISESISEIDFVKSLFSSSYAKAYDNTGLLTNKTVMAHGVHLEDEEISLLKERGTSVSHCPASNTMLSSGFCDVIRLIKSGIKVGLGTDVSGGNSMSIQYAIVRALEVSHHLEFVKKQDIKGTGKLPKADEEYKPLNYKQAIYLATLGGAEALALDDITGNFVVGKEFDALIVDTSLYPINQLDKYNVESYKKKSAEEKLWEKVQKFIYCGDDRNILNVFVAGREIKQSNNQVLN